ncbi:N-acetyltransferase eco isoform X2 [Athalia rosae]|uniref:N-acetyltransferase eco isoform X2 n=1 Tax=Athalia rosae TaxID=37344 RepID=UPI0020338E23|nr:N-acetyltransferase eco isoform X2 [Athalia rosae]
MLTGGGPSSVTAEAFSTPRRAQKRLFVAAHSSSKRNLFRDDRRSSPAGGVSGDESDLGPMSPLALSDATPSSSTNSPRRTFDSPLAAFVPEALSRRRACQAAPVVPISTPVLPVASGEKTIPLDESVHWKSGITDTPKRSFGREVQNEPAFNSEIKAETPQKEDSPVKKLITPLGSVTKEAALPRLHHRKFSNSIVADGNSSPIDDKENRSKRIASDDIAPASVKLFKSDECSSVPRARAALFQEKKEEFKLSTKSFYSSPPTNLPVRGSSVSIDRNEVRRGQKRRSLPAKSNHGRSSKRHRYGEINAGIGHCIRKPRPKKHVSRVEASKKRNKINNSSPTLVEMQDDTIDAGLANIFSTIHQPELEKNADILAPAIEQATSPYVDPRRKFFKTNRTLVNNSLATVTVNNMIKLQVSHGKLKLKPRQSTACKNILAKSKDVNIVLDASDLTVDDPKFVVPTNEKSVTDILKILENDWADDEYDSMESLTVEHRQPLSPLKPSMIQNDITMSPASELINMTSVMNIKDGIAPNFEAQSVANNANQNKETRFYPLFSKDFAGSGAIRDSPKKINHGRKRTMGWQLAAKTAYKDDKQYQLDVGQKRFGATQCPQCGVVYQLGDPDDESSHRNYHDNWKILKFPGWKRERVVSTDPYTSSRIILVESGDSKNYWKKVSEILAFVDRDLGLAETKLSDYQKDKIYLYIRNREVIGVLAAEYITAAYSMIPDLSDIDCCSSESSAVKCGVKVLWTSMTYRKQGIATKLMDTLRGNFYLGYILSIDDIAFSIPTPEGKAFAEKYTKTRSYKVYN